MFILQYVWESRNKKYKKCSERKYCKPKKKLDLGIVNGILKLEMLLWHMHRIMYCFS